MGTSNDPKTTENSAQQGVPAGDQRPTNERDGARNISADVHVPGPYPSDRDHTTGAPGASEPEPGKEDRDTGSLGDLVEGIGAPPVEAEAGQAGGGTARQDNRIPETPREEAQQLRDESAPGGAPEGADVETGRRKGQGLPPSSVGRSDDTPQTPAT